MPISVDQFKAILEDHNPFFRSSTESYEEEALALKNHIDKGHTVYDSVCFLWDICDSPPRYGSKMKIVADVQNLLYGIGL